MESSYPSSSISGRGCPESELIPPMNPFGGTRPPFKRKKRDFSSNAADISQFKTNL